MSQTFEKTAKSGQNTHFLAYQYYGLCANRMERGGAPHGSNHSVMHFYRGIPSLMPMKKDLHHLWHSDRVTRQICKNYDARTVLHHIVGYFF